MFICSHKVNNKLLRVEFVTQNFLLSLFARLGRNYIVKVSLKTLADDSFLRIINRKIHSRYIAGVYILGIALAASKNFFLSTWRRNATMSLDLLLQGRKVSEGNICCRSKAGAAKLHEVKSTFFPYSIRYFSPDFS